MKKNMREGFAQAAASMIRQESKAGRLIDEAEIFRRVADQFHGPLQPEEFRNLLKKTAEENEDLSELAAGDGSRHYHSSQYMTRAYAMILLQKQGDPLRLIAETVRHNSSDYTRPVPLDLFTQPPFDLARQEVLHRLERMETLEEFRDIELTMTSASSVFLYSTLYLESGHASMLAEWLDVGQFDNP